MVDLIKRYMHRGKQGGKKIRKPHHKHWARRYLPLKRLILLNICIKYRLGCLYVKCPG